MLPLRQAIRGSFRHLANSYFKKDQYLFNQSYGISRNILSFREISKTRYGTTSVSFYILWIYLVLMYAVVLVKTT